MPIQAKGQLRPEKSAYHPIALLAKSSEKDISLLLPRACSTMDKIVDRYAITIYPYSIERDFPRRLQLWAKPLIPLLALIKKDIAIPQNKTKHICKKRKK